MADAAPETPPAVPAKKLPIKTIAVVAALMVLEGVGVVAFLGFSSRHPASAEAKIEGKGDADHEAQVEVPLIAEKFQNLQTGKIWIWDIEVFVKVKEKNKEFVDGELSKRGAEIKEGIAQIIRRAQSSQLKEPGLETLNRQLAAFMNKLLGNDPDGNSRFERVLIPKCRGFPAEG
jgi:flagellar basal body-associated protein FliL